MSYNHKEIEKKWQEKWEKDELYKTAEDPSKPKAYVLDMFPYPSGEGLHVGHPKGYIATDVYSRFKRMNGFNVLHPMGWDAFGLPAENFAIKHKIHPRVAVEKNIATFKEQLKKIGFNYDWSREINTTDPEFYKWTQWIFLKLYEKGLAYQSYEPINWCPSCQTGLANEDLEGGRCERCGSEVEKRPMRQWVLKITDYAERLLSDLDGLEWPESIKESQRNWIGKSEGAVFDFKLKITSNQQPATNHIEVFTTRPDTLYGVTYVVLAPEHEFITIYRNSIQNWDEVEKYIQVAKQKEEIERTNAEKEKTGVKLEGIVAIHPATGEEIPVFIADYVLGSYGTGAVMAVPAHDERDFEFAKKYDLPVKQVIAPHLIDENNPPQEGKPSSPRTGIIAFVKHSERDEFISLKWRSQDWHTAIVGGVEDGEDEIEAAKREVFEETGYKNLKFVKRYPWKTRSDFFAAHKDVNREATTSILFFELVNEDREEISDEEKAKHDIEWLSFDNFDELHPMVEKEYVKRWLECGDEACTDPGLLIDSKEFSGLPSFVAASQITEKFGRKATTYKIRDWVFSRQRYWGEPIPIVHCKMCGVVPVPESELPVRLPEVESYEPTGTGESPLADIPEWVSTVCPKCGGEAKRETNTMPQWAGSSWYYLRYIDPSNGAALVDKEKEKYWMPVDLYVGGAEHATRHLIYARFWHKFLNDIGVISTLEPFSRLEHVGLILASDGRKMSKRYGNVINPDEIVDVVGADTLRIYEMFMGPFSQSISWDTNSIAGARRFLERTWKLRERVAEGFEDSEETKRVWNRTIKKVGEDIEQFKFNTAISTMMECVNVFEKTDHLSEVSFLSLVRILAPFAPHVTEELWHELGGEGSIHEQFWPQYDELMLEDEVVGVAVQVDGKVRSVIQISRDLAQQSAENEARQLPDVLKWIEGKEIKRVVYVPGRIINFITGS